MADQVTSEPHHFIAHLQHEIMRHQDAIDKLKSDGHPCPDAERELQRLKERLVPLENPASLH